MYFCKKPIVTYQPFESTPFLNITYVLGSKSHRLQCNRQHKNGQNSKYQPSNQYYIHFTLSPKSINFSPILWREQSFTSLKADFCQDINRVSSLSRCANCSVNPKEKKSSKYKYSFFFLNLSNH